jgi:menaquinone-dependent protoporphyrinogen oxidase
MNVLVGYATAQGSTEGIAKRIADGLRAGGVNVCVEELGGLANLQGYDAAVLGSAIHSGRWMAEGSRQLLRHSGDLRDRPVWLFSVSSVGDSSSFFPRAIANGIRKMRGETKEIAGFRKVLAVQDHRNFAGAIKKGDWGRSGDLFLHLLGGRRGDHRDWADIDRWADTIAAEFTAKAAMSRV